MKCDIHHQKNAHPKTSPTSLMGCSDSDFNHQNFSLNIIKSEMCMNLWCVVTEKKHNAN